MIGRIILDTGPLVAFLDRRDAHHDWAKARFRDTLAPFLTCEAVLTEACFLLRKAPQLESEVLKHVTQGILNVGLRLGDEAGAVAALMSRYANVPMSLADACLVRMAEIHPSSRILTLDSDFRVYRKDGRTSIEAILPEDRT